MKSLFALLTLSTYLTACTTYQYYSMTGDLPLAEDQSFHFTSNAVEVNYKFGENGILIMDICNRSDAMIFIDWERSSLIFNQETIPFPQDEAYFQGNASYNHPLGQDFEGVIQSNPHRRYIPPKTRLKESVHLNFANYLNLNETIFEENTVTGSTKTYRYSKDNSPFAFQTYLYFSDLKEKKEPIIVHNSFWTQSIVSNMTEVTSQEYNQFALEDYNDAGYGLFAIVVGAGLIYLVAVADEESQGDL